MNGTGLIKRDIRLFVSLIGTLIVIGLLFVYSSSSIFSLEKFGSSYYFLKKQCIGIVLGIGGLLIIQLIPSSFIKRGAPFLFLLSLGITSLTLVPFISRHIHGSSRWISCGGIIWQPSELLKIAFILYLAYVLSKKQKKYSFFYGFLPVMVIAFFPALILLRQPDFGLTITLCITALTMLFLASFHLRHLVMTVCFLIPTSILLIIIKPYRMQRILTFLNPWSDPKGSGFQIIQSLIAIGSGGFSGLGIAQSKQKFFYLPMQHTDFIFSIIAEETGFIGSCIIIFLYTSILYYGIKIARASADPFTQFVIMGFVILVNFQALINIAVTVGLVPTKGIGLPFVSYGNSALICNIWMVGIILNLLRNEMYQAHRF